MSEAMTSESIVEAEWLLKGYWSKMRFAFQTKKGAWSDVDVLAYNPEERHLVISESKVRGSKDIVFAYTEYTEGEYGSILEYDDDNYFSFLRYLPLLCSDGVIFGDFRKMVTKITVQLVSNYVVTEEAKASAYSSIKQNITKYKLPVNVEFLLDTTLDVIARIIVEERASGQGKRYGHPVLDIAREINRYFYPSVRYAGRSKASVENVKQQAITKFIEAIGSKNA
jgi:hypothetical protein